MGIFSERQFWQNKKNWEFRPTNGMQLMRFTVAFVPFPALHSSKGRKWRHVFEESFNLALDENIQVDSVGKGETTIVNIDCSCAAQVDLTHPFTIQLRVNNVALSNCFFWRGVEESPLSAILSIFRDGVKILTYGPVHN